MSNAFRPHLRLRKERDFARVYQARLFAADAVLIVNAGASSLPHPRLGLSISKRVGNAVVRNRWKRLIREAFRLSQSDLPAGLDLIVRPQRDSRAELDSIRKSLVSLARRLAKKVGAERERSEVGGQP